MLSPEDRRIVATFAARVRARFPTARIWVYGSRCRGDVERESDLDVCVVLNQVDRQADARIRDAAWEIGFDNDRVISTVVMDELQFEQGPMSESTLVANILREGVAA